MHSCHQGICAAKVKGSSFVLISRFKVIFFAAGLLCLRIAERQVICHNKTIFDITNIEYYSVLKISAGF